MFSLYDSKAEYYWEPRFEKSAGMVLRALGDAINHPDKKSQVAQHPGDFTMFEIGEWNEQNCEFDIYKAKISLGCCIELIDQNTPVPNLTGLTGGDDGAANS